MKTGTRLLLLAPIVLFITACQNPKPPSTLAVSSSIAATATPTVAITPTLLQSTSTPQPEVTIYPFLPTPTQTPFVTQTLIIPGLGFQLTDIAFVDALHGWALGFDGNGEARMRATNDGGKTLRSIPSPKAHLTANGYEIYYVRFANLKDGWAFFPGLYSTHDGGMSWTAEPHDGDIVALEPADGSVWAVERSACSNDDGSFLCSFTLLVYDYKERKFKPSATQPLMRGDDAQLVRTDSLTAWIFSEFESFDKQTSMAQTIGTLTATYDGGKSWQVLTSMPQQLLMRCHFTVGASQLWLLCGDQPAGAMSVKILYKSSDRGVHWETASSTGMPPDFHNWVGNIPIGGHIRDFIVTASDCALIALNRGTLIRSMDGGQTWSDTLGSTDELFFSRIIFVDNLHGWVSVDGPRGEIIYRTTDGGTTWQNVVVQ